MKKSNYKKIISLVLSAAMILGCIFVSTPAQVSAEESEYRYLWTMESESMSNVSNYSTLYDHHKNLGNAGFDMDTYVNSELGDSIIKNFYYFLNYTNEMDPEVLKYWEEEMGTLKEMHDDHGEDRKWVSYTPLEALAENNEKEYPVMIVYHGNNNTTFMSETYGYAQLAAEKGFICVIPWADNATTYEEDMEWIMDVLKEDYPIDESRIYAAGFSLGGRSVVQEAIRTPNRYAAINVGGQPLAGTRSANDPIPDSEWEKLNDLPVLHMCGSVEQNSQLPYGYNRVIGGELQVESLNKWFEINGVNRRTSLEECLDLAENSEDAIERALGLAADEAYIQYLDGTNYYTGDYFNEDGVNMIKVISIEGQNHWVSGSYAEVVWDYVSQFAKDPETGELIVLDEEEGYDYPDKYLWFVEDGWLPGMSLYQHHGSLGNSDFNIDDCVNSELGESVTRHMYNTIMYDDEMDPEILQYWQDRGTLKEMHDGDDYDHHWVSYTPLEALKENNTKKYPVVFLFHGSTDTTLITESYGYAQLAAQEGFICVSPWADNNDPDTLAEDMDRILEVLRSDYPIDENRIFGVGFSLGGRSVVQEAIRNPELFTAINVGGQPLAGTRSASSPIPDEDWAKLNDIGVLHMNGTVEQNNQLPYGYNRVIGGELQVESLNIWFNINRVNERTTLAECQDLAENSNDPIARNLGLIAHDNYIQKLDGTNYYTGDYYNEDGLNVMKVVAVEGVGHFMAGSYADVAWDFFSKLATDPNTGRLIEYDDSEKDNTFRDYVQEAYDIVAAQQGGTEYNNMPVDVQKAFDTHLIAAATVLAKDNPTDTELWEALKAIFAASDLLGMQIGDTALLAALIDEIEKMDMNLYRTVGQEELTAALTNAKNVLNEGEPLEETVTNAVTQLISARLLLRLRANTSVLEQALAKAKSLKLSDYTDESIQASNIRALIIEAEPMLNDRDVEQDDVDEMAAAIYLAIDTLKLKDKDGDDGNKSTDDSNNSTAGDDGKDGGKKGDDSKNSGKGGKTTTPKTGDNSVVAIFIIVMFSGLALMNAMKKKKFN